MERIVPEIDEIVKFYGEEKIEKIARETRFVQRDSKLGGTEFLAFMTNGLYSCPSATLNQMVSMLKDMNPRLEITASGLQQRIVGNSVDFLKRMLCEAMNLLVTNRIDESLGQLLNPFEKVHLLDSTQISVPPHLSYKWSGNGGSASAAGVKFHLMLDYKSGKYEEIVLTDGISSDHTYMKEAVSQIGEGELIIHDLGYLNKDSMVKLSKNGAYFLSRYNHRTGLHTRNEDGAFESFDLEEALKKLSRKGETRGEFCVYIVTDDGYCAVRLIVERVPRRIANERRRKARKTAKKKGRSPSKKHLYFQNWSLYITNAGAEILPAEQVGFVYSLRWYIELVFKSWKSYHGLDEVTGKREERIESFIYGRLIMIVIMAFLFGSIRRYVWTTKKREASLLKVISHFQQKIQYTLPLILNSESFGDFLSKEFLEACRLCLMDQRKRPTTAQKLREDKAA